MSEKCQLCNEEIGTGYTDLDMNGNVKRRVILCDKCVDKIYWVRREK